MFPDFEFEQCLITEVVLFAPTPRRRLKPSPSPPPTVLPLAASAVHPPDRRRWPSLSPATTFVLPGRRRVSVRGRPPPPLVFPDTRTRMHVCRSDAEGVTQSGINGRAARVNNVHDIISRAPSPATLRRTPFARAAGLVFPAFLISFS